MFLTLLILFSQSAQADLCKKWAPSERWGDVPKVAAEASGIIVSKNFPDRIYHINDGKISALIISDFKGKKVKEVSLEEIKAKDAEDLAYGQCPDKKGDCIYIADIGDNERSRAEIKIIILRETDFGDSAKVLDTWRLKYPEGPHNAEAMALHPNGDLVIVTKEKKKKEGRPAQIFKTSIFNPGEKLVHLGEVDLPKLSKNSNIEDLVVTGMTISSDGKRFILLTYLRAWEFNIDLSQPIMTTEKMKLGVDYQPVAIEQLRQQEAITFLPNQNAFIYSSENGQNGYFLYNEIAVNVVRCLD